MKKTKQNKETINQQQQQEILEIKKQRKVKCPRRFHFLENFSLKEALWNAYMSRMSKGKFSIKLYNSSKMFL